MTRITSRRRFPLEGRDSARAVVALALLLLAVAPLALAQGGTWTTRSPMITPRCCAAAAASGGQLYIAGGESSYAVEAYDPKSDRWVQKAPIPSYCGGGGAGVVGEVIYVAGCYDPSSGQFDAAYAYSPKNDTWAAVARMPTPREYPMVAALGDLVYAVGGLRPVAQHYGVPLNVVEAYDPKTNSWGTKAPLPTARWQGTIAATGGRIYVLGGLADYNATVTGANEAYNPVSNGWTERASMPTPRYGAVGGTIAGRVYVVGGERTYDPRSLSGVSEAYDPATDAWVTAATDPSPEIRSSGGVIEDTLFVVGGLDSVQFNELQINEAFSPFEKVNIDIRPGDPNNAINLKSGGVVQVAILGSATFDPKTVEPSTVTFAGAAAAIQGKGVAMTTIADVNHDGYPDLILFFRTQDLQLTTADTEAVLYGKTYSGTPIRGSGPVRILAPARH